MHNFNHQKTVIIKTQGGICSQIAYFALGKHLEDLGYVVKFDNLWFKENGKDMDGIFVRNYDFDKAFPEIIVNFATEDEIKIFQEKYNVGEKHEKMETNMYVCGYPERFSLFIKYIDFFKKFFNPYDSFQVTDICEEIKANVSCAVHVRRGDLAKPHSVYGEPLSIDYFSKVIPFVNSMQKNIKFFFFSDEMDWVKDNIIPNLSSDIEYKLVDKNGSDRGYLDLWLISKCNYIIASKGSMGRFAKFLGAEDTKIIAPGKDTILVM